jgi:hypothetical protein
MHPVVTAAMILGDRYAPALDTTLDEAAAVAAAVAAAASRAGVTPAQVRAWLGGDYADAHAILVRHGTHGSYASARILAAHAQAPERIRAAVADLITDALADAEREGCDPGYDYVDDPRPQWVVRVIWPSGRIDVRYIKAGSSDCASQRAAWQWPAATRIHVFFDHRYEALRAQEAAENEDSMWDYTPHPGEIQ